MVLAGGSMGACSGESAEPLAVRQGHEEATASRAPATPNVSRAVASEGLDDGSGYAIPMCNANPDPCCRFPDLPECNVDAGPEADVDDAGAEASCDGSK
jgi:hypothetical protein